MTTVRRKSKTAEALDLLALAKKFAAQRVAKNAAAENTKVANTLRDEIMPVIARVGVAHGEKGQHLAIELLEPVDGCTRLVRRTNSSTFINVDRAEDLAMRNGYLEEIQHAGISVGFVGTPAEIRKVKAVLRKLGVLDLPNADIEEKEQFSQERLMAYHQRHPEKLTEQLLDGLYDTDKTYSFNPE